MKGRLERENKSQKGVWVEEGTGGEAGVSLGWVTKSTAKFVTQHRAAGFKGLLEA